MERFLEIGKIVSLHGIAGEVKIYPWCDGPEVIAPIKTLYLDAKGEKKLSVTCRRHDRMALCKIEGCTTPEQARLYINRVLYAERKDIKLEKDSHFIADIIGLSVVNELTGETVGEVCDVTPSAASDIYYVKMKDGSVRLVPAIKEFVKNIDIEKNEMLVRPIKGLLDDEI